ncbi:MAG: HNH endonuclease [Planctomycetaceae bacterium]
MTDARVSQKTKRFVAERAGFYCEYCWSTARICPGGFHVEHIVPRISAGTNLISNLCYACAGCNGAKSAATSGFDSETGREVRLFHPRRDHWFEHFTWSRDCCEIIPLTAVGRATLKKLRLNRSEAVEQRRIFTRLGKHPPTPTLPSKREGKP